MYIYIYTKVNHDSRRSCSLGVCWVGLRVHFILRCPNNHLIELATSFLPRVCQALRQSSFLIFLEWREDINLFSIGTSGTKASWLLQQDLCTAPFNPEFLLETTPKRLRKVSIHENGNLHTSHQQCENVALSRCLRYSASRSSEDFDIIFLKLPGEISAGAQDRGKFSKRQLLTARHNEGDVATAMGECYECLWRWFHGHP